MSTLFSTVSGVFDSVVGIISQQTQNRSSSENKHDSHKFAYVGFNQDCTRICVGSSRGFRIYQCDPFSRMYSWSKYPCRQVAMLFETSLVACVGASERKESSLKHVSLYNINNDNSEFCRYDFPSNVCNIKMNKSRLMVALDRKIHIFDLKTLKPIDEIETCYNPDGIFDLCNDDDNCLVAYPQQTTSSILREVNNTGGHTSNSSGNSSSNSSSSSSSSNTSRFHNHIDLLYKNITNVARASISSESNNNISQGTKEDVLNSSTNSKGDIANISNNNIRNMNVNDTYTTKVLESQGKIAIMDAFTLQMRTIIEAHDAAIQALAFNSDGSLLATASTTGTVIRVFTIPIGKHKHSFRRGSSQAKIQSLAFNPSSTLLCCSSSSSTIHIFNLAQTQHHEQSAVAAVNIMSDYLPQTVMNCIEQPRSFAQISLKLEPRDIVRCGFIRDCTVVVATQSGYFYRYEVPVEGGLCKLEEEHSLKKLKREDKGTTIFTNANNGNFIEEKQMIDTSHLNQNDNNAISRSFTSTFPTRVSSISKESQELMPQEEEEEKKEEEKEEQDNKKKEDNTLKYISNGDKSSKKKKYQNHNRNHNHHHNHNHNHKENKNENRHDNYGKKSLSQDINPIQPSTVLHVLDSHPDNNRVVLKNFDKNSPPLLEKPSAVWFGEPSEEWNNDNDNEENNHHDNNPQMDYNGHIIEEIPAEPGAIGYIDTDDDHHHHHWNHEAISDKAQPNSEIDGGLP